MQRKTRVGAGVLSIVLLVMVSGCANLRPTETLSATGPVTEVKKLGTSIDRHDLGLVKAFVATYTASSGAPTDNTKAQEFLSAGLQLVKTNCDDFFHGLGRARQDLNFTQRSIGLGGATAATIAGISGVHAETLALIAAGITGVLGLTDIYSDEYLFAPDIASVEQLIHSAQDEYIKQIDQQQLRPTLNFYSAHGLIQEFQSFCEVQTIRNLVNAAIKAGKFTAVSTDDEANAKAQATADSIATISRVAKKQLTTEESALLYWEYGLGSSDADTAAKAKIAAVVQAVNSDGTKTQDLRFAMAALTLPAKKTLETVIQGLKNGGAPPPGAPAPRLNQAGSGAALPSRILLQIGR